MPIKAINRELNLPNIFSQKLFVSQAFFDVETLFGAYRPFAMNVLMLHNEDDHMAIIVSDNDVKEIEKVLHQEKTIFGYSASIVDPTGTASLVRLGKFEANEISMTLLCEVLIFAGSTNILDDEKWTKYLTDWVNVDYHRRSAFYNRIVLSNKEGMRFSKGQMMHPLERNTEPIRTEDHDFMLLYALNSKTNELRKYFTLLLSRESKDLQKILEVALIIQKVNPSKGKEFIKVALKTVKDFLTDETFLLSQMDSSKQRILELAEKIIFASDFAIFKFFPRLNCRWRLLKSTLPRLCDSLVNRIANYMGDLGSGDIRSGSNIQRATQFLSALKTNEFWKTDPEDLLKILPNSVFSVKHKKFDSKLTELFSSITDENLRSAFINKRSKEFSDLNTMVGPEFVRAILPRNPDEELMEIIFKTLFQTLSASNGLSEKQLGLADLKFAGKPVDEYEWFRLSDFAKYVYNYEYSMEMMVRLARLFWNEGELPSVVKDLEKLLGAK